MVYISPILSSLPRFLSLDDMNLARFLSSVIGLISNRPKDEILLPSVGQPALKLPVPSPQ